MCLSIQGTTLDTSIAYIRGSRGFITEESKLLTDLPQNADFGKQEIQ